MKYIEYVNSRDRTTSSASSSDFTVRLSKSYNNIRSVELLGYTIANAIYTINSSNNQLRWVEYDIPDYTTRLVSIPSKNYSASQLATEITTLMTTNSFTGLVYNVSYDSQTMKYTITATGSVGLTFYLDFNGLSNSCASELGFSDTYVGTSGTTITSQNIIRLDKTFILMETDILNDIQGGPNGQGTCSFMLQLPANGTTETFYTEVIEHQLEGIYSMSQMKIRLKDFKNRVVDMNGSDHIFIFQLSDCKH